jgi:hypothetical protein
MHAASVVHLSAPLAPRDLVAQVGQRNVSTKLHDQIVLTELTGAPTFFADDPHEVAGGDRRAGSSGYHTPHAASRVLHVTLTTRVHMGMADGLLMSGSLSTISMASPAKR